ncbi:MAG: hypothetical protein HOO15_00555 [Flavobacteriales bacterium]|nr:hypothetical protein [Flavobacteriales bacterium]
MKKLLLLLICVPLMFSCGDSEDNEKTKSNGKIRFKDYNNGDHYIGSFKRNSPHGTGTYIYSNGDKYVGEWKKGERHGFGVSMFKNEINYGHWNNGLRNSKFLTFDLDSNLKYVSNFSDGKYHGVQKFYFDKFHGSLSGGFIEEIYIDDSLINPIKVYNSDLQMLFNVSVDKSGIVISSECKDDYGNIINCYDSYFGDWFYLDDYDNEIYLDIVYPL